MNYRLQPDCPAHLEHRAELKWLERERQRIEGRIEELTRILRVVYGEVDQ